MMLYTFTSAHEVLLLPRPRNDLYCVGWGVKLYSIQSNLGVIVLVIW